jgi:hypothetical protein
MEFLGLSIRRNGLSAVEPDAIGELPPIIPKSVLDLLTRTRLLYRLWWFAHYATGLAGVIAGALLTALTSAPPSGGAGTGISNSLIEMREYAWLIGIIAAVATSLVTFLGPLHKAERYWSAYHLLEQACLEYLGNDNDPKLGKLMKRVMHVRRILQVADADEKITGELKDKVAAGSELSGA